MDFLKKLWPTCFKVKEKDVASLIVQLLIFLVFCIVGGFFIGIVIKILPILGIFGGLVELYGVVGIVLCFLKFFDVIKD